MTKTAFRGIVTFCSLCSLLLCAAFTVYAYHRQLFTSEEALQAYIAGFGAIGALVFVLFQATQVVIPILPGGLGCLGGVVLFGPWLGFVYNYIGICLGSVAAFCIAKNCGRPVLYSLFNEKTIDKYDAWTGQGFDKWFALAIFLPVAPDDFLCYLAGTTRMSLRRFTAIVLLGKPAAIALYSLGLHMLLQQILTLVR